MSQIIDGEKYGNRWGYAGKGFVMELFLGIIYAWSIFVVPLETALEVTRSQITVTYSIAMSFFCIGQFTGAYWGNKLGTVRAITIGGTVLAAGFFLVSFAASLWYLYIMYGVVCAYALGVANNNLLSFAPRWFPDKTGLALGIICMGFGLSSLILGTIATWLMDQIGWVATFRILAGLCLIMVAGISLFLKAPPLGYKPAGWAPKQGSADTSKGFTRLQMCKQPRFWVMYAWYFVNHFGAYMVLSCIVPYGLEMGMAAIMSAVVGGILGTCNGLGRPILGTMADRMSRKATMILDSLLMVVGLLCLTYLPRVIDPFWGTVIGAMLIGFSLGGSITIGNSHVRAYYGSKHVASNMGIICTPDLPTGILGPMIAVAIFSATGTYSLAFMIAAVIVLISAVFPFFIGVPPALPDE